MDEGDEVGDGEGGEVAGRGPARRAARRRRRPACGGPAGGRGRRGAARSGRPDRPARAGPRRTRRHPSVRVDVEERAHQLGLSPGSSPLLLPLLLVLERELEHPLRVVGDDVDARPLKKRVGVPRTAGRASACEPGDLVAVLAPARRAACAGSAPSLPSSVGVAPPARRREAWGRRREVVERPEDRPGRGPTRRPGGRLGAGVRLDGEGLVVEPHPARVVAHELLQHRPQQLAVGAGEVGELDQRDRAPGRRAAGRSAATSRRARLGGRRRRSSRSRVFGPRRAAPMRRAGPPAGPSAWRGWQPPVLRRHCETVCGQPQ